MRIGDIITRTLLGLVLLPFRALVEPRPLAAKPPRPREPGQGPPSIPRPR